MTFTAEFDASSEYSSNQTLRQAFLLSQLDFHYLISSCFDFYLTDSAYSANLMNFEAQWIIDGIVQSGAIRVFINTFLFLCFDAHAHAFQQFCCRVHVTTIPTVPA